MASDRRGRADLTGALPVFPTFETARRLRASKCLPDTPAGLPTLPVLNRLHPLVATLITAHAAHAGAEEEGSSQPNRLETVVVTATRSSIDLSDAPASVTLVSREAIEQRNVSRITDALQTVPGLSMGRGENGQSNSFEGGFSLRGMETRRTLVLLDGLQPLQSGSSQGVNWLTVFPDDVERVEVVSGPFAALYGSNAMGGVINIISKRPDRDETTLRGKVGFRDAAGQDTSVYLRRALAHGLGIAAGVSLVDRDGYVSERTVRTPTMGPPGTPVTGAIPTTTRDGTPAYIVGDRGRQPWTQQHALLRLSWQATERDRLQAGVARAEARQGFERYNTYLVDAAGAPVSSGILGINGQRVTLSETQFVGSTPLVQDSTRVFAGYARELDGGGEFKAEVSRIRRGFTFPTAGPNASWDSGPGSLTDSPDATLDAVTTWGLPVGQRHFVIAGLSLHRDTAERRSYTLTDWRDADSRTSVNNGYDARTSTTSAFLQDEFRAGANWTLYAGARLDRWETRGRFFQNTAPSVETTYPERGDTAFNPKLSAVYKVAPSVTLHASWGKAFRAPSNLDLYSTTVQGSSISPTGRLTIQGDPELRPEHANGWELGGEWRAATWLRAGAAVYKTRLTDLIYAKQVDLSLTQRINAGKARSQGVELTLQARPLRWLEAVAHASWIDTEVLANEADPGSVGKRLTQVPQRLSYLGLIATQGAWSATLEARYAGRTYATAQNTDTVHGVPGSSDPVTMVHARMGLRLSEQARIAMSVNNVFDRVQYTFAQLPRRSVTGELVLSF